MNTGEIIIYQNKQGDIKIDVRLEDETVWLNIEQMTLLFGKSRATINEHILNIFKEGELVENQVMRKIGISDFSTKPTNFYNLDIIISVGYRVKSQQGTQFRIWATQRLRDYIIKGYSINDKLKLEQYEDLKKTLKLLSHVIENQQLTTDESSSLLKIVTDYTYGLDTLDKYDYQKLIIEQTTSKEAVYVTYDDAKKVIDNLKEKFNHSNWFGNEKDQSFKSSIATIYQTFDGVELYPSIEEKAAMLLYLITKNHSFTDGNKRIAAFIFLWFMEKNEILYNPDGSKRIDNNALVALTLMIAESRPDEKDIMIKVIVNLINKNNI